MGHQQPVSVECLHTHPQLESVLWQGACCPPPASAPRWQLPERWVLAPGGRAGRVPSARGLRAAHRPLLPLEEKRC